MCLVCWICRNTRRDKVRNKYIFTSAGIANIEEKMRECDIAYGCTSFEWNLCKLKEQTDNQRKHEWR